MSYRSHDEDPPTDDTWIAEVVFDPSTVQKLAEKKPAVTATHVREAVLFGASDQESWHYDPLPSRGWRLVTVGTPAGTSRQLVAYLRPVDHGGGTWECLTAYWLDT